MTWVARLQRAFTTLTELFDRVGLYTNVAKKVSIAYHPYRELWGDSVEAYGIKMMEEGNTYLGRP